MEKELSKLSNDFIDKLRSDKNYYGKFGKTFLSYQMFWADAPLP